VVEGTLAKGEIAYIVDGEERRLFRMEKNNNRKRRVIWSFHFFFSPDHVKPFCQTRYHNGFCNLEQLTKGDN
jgi:hypothetical protein